MIIKEINWSAVINQFTDRMIFPIGFLKTTKIQIWVFALRHHTIIFNNLQIENQILSDKITFNSDCLGLLISTTINLKMFIWIWKQLDV